MILISVKSEVVDDKRQFETDAKAERFLKRIHSLHMNHRFKIAGRKPKLKRGKGSKALNAKLRSDWEFTMGSCINLRIEIINTKYNQLNLAI